MRSRSLFPFVLGVAAIIGFGACTGKPENSPQIRKRFADLDALQKQVDEGNTTIAMLSSDIRLLTEQLSELRAMSPDATGTSEAVRRIDNLESRLTQMESSGPATRTAAGTPPPRDTVTNPDSPATEMAGSSTPGVVPVNLRNPILAGTDAVAAAPEPGAAPAPKLAAAKPKPAATTPKATAKPSTATGSGNNKAPAASAARGIYYKAVAGDTIDSVAKKHGVSVADILKANKLPAGARLLSGQNIFVPKSS